MTVTSVVQRSIKRHGRAAGLPGWVWLFVLEGAATVIFGIALRVIARLLVTSIFAASAGHLLCISADIAYPSYQPSHMRTLGHKSVGHVHFALSVAM